MTAAGCKLGELMLQIMGRFCLDLQNQSAAHRADKFAGCSTKQVCMQLLSDGGALCLGKMSRMSDFRLQTGLDKDGLDRSSAGSAF